MCRKELNIEIIKVFPRLYILLIRGTRNYHVTVDYNAKSKISYLTDTFRKKQQFIAYNRQQPDRKLNI